MAHQPGPTHHDDPRGARRYRIRGLIGKGGFGSVYRATLIGQDGFEKDVAVKLLHADQVDPTTLARFRDEARILGLVRDRAVVGVDPPTRLEGRWALVMELADGVSLSRIVKKLGVLPPRVAAEIIEEVARVLHAVYRQPGPDGEPLSLLHRDLKPGNLQITPSGSVKVLDFGIAKADFNAREAETSSHIVGTYKYMAPERLLGQEVPAGDIYSLGVVLRRTAFGERPVSPGVFQPPEEAPTEEMDPPEPMHLLKGLALRMTSLKPEERPTAREVERQCRALAEKLDGPRLRDWAEVTVPRDLPLREDELVGTLLTETHALDPLVDPASTGPSSADSVTTPSRRVFRTGSALLSIVAVLLVLSGLVGLAAAGVAYTMMGDPADPADPVTDATAVTDVTAPEPAPTDPVDPPVPPDDAPGDPVESEPPSPTEPPAAAPPPVPITRPSPVAPSTPSPVPEPPPVRPEPAPEPEPPATDAVLHPITFGSNPAGAVVVVDGSPIGETPIVAHPLAEGTHTLKLSLPDREMIQSITVGPNRPVRYMWMDGAWKSYL